jgi:sensor domain CHASE-containing protein
MTEFTEKEKQIMAVGMMVFLVIMASIIVYVLYQWHLSNLRNEETDRQMERLRILEGEQ